MDSVLSNEKLSVFPGVKAGPPSHWIAFPSEELFDPVMFADQPAGKVIFVGLASIKSAPGIHANQKVPMFVVPVSVS